VWAWISRFREPVAATGAVPATPDSAASGRAVLLWAAVVGWCAVMLLFIPIGYRISMVDKHFFVAIPFMMLASAAVIDRFWQHTRYGWPVRAATLVLCCYLGLSALTLWLTRIAIVRQVYE
jgi:hypothetical protein